MALIAGCRFPGGCWIRLFGYGVGIRRLHRYPLLFSERHGYARLWRVGGWAIKWLPRARCS